MDLMINHFERISAVLCVALLGTANVATASTLVIDFTGEAETLTGEFGAEGAVGDIVSGSIMFDANLPVTTSSGVTAFGLQRDLQMRLSMGAELALTSISYTIGNLTVTMPNFGGGSNVFNLDFSTLENHPTATDDRIYMYAQNSGTQAQFSLESDDLFDGNPLAGLSLELLQSINNDVLNTATSITEIPNERRFTRSSFSTGSGLLEMNVQNVTAREIGISPVPLPSSIILAMIGLGLLGGVKLRGSVV